MLTARKNGDFKTRVAINLVRRKTLFVGICGLVLRNSVNVDPVITSERCAFFVPLGGIYFHKLNLHHINQCKHIIAS